MKKSYGLLGSLLIGFIVMFAAFGPLLSNHSYFETHLHLKNQPPSFSHWFGTDDLGRDIFTRVWIGARISLFVGLTAALIDLFIGVLWGSIAAFCGGKIDALLMRTADILYALPYMLVVIALMMILEPGLLSTLAAMTALGWITMARIVRGQLIQIKQQDYVLAVTALGATFPRILFRHLIPNALGSIIVTLTFTIPSAIFIEAFLSFLGLGIQAPMASWGTMASDGLPALAYYPWRLFFPAFFMSMTMLAFNMIGEALRDATDTHR